MHANCESTNKSPRILNAAENKFDTVICWQMRKTFHKAKTQSDEFKVTTSKDPLTNNQAVTSMKNLTTTLSYPKIPTYSWTFASIPNWTWSCSRLLCFAQISNLWLAPLHGSQYVINSSNLIDCCWLQNSLLHKRWRSGSNWLQNPKAYKRSSFTQSIWVLGLCFHSWWLLK